MKTKSNALLVVCLLIYLVLHDIPCFGQANHHDKAFTPWVSLAELNAFMKTFDAKTPGEKNYWDKGHLITGVEGRWHDGIPQYRIRYGDAPNNRGHWWYWFINQDPKDFHQKIHDYADQGFILADYNSFEWPDGTLRYQAVWHKYGKLKNPAKDKPVATEPEKPIPTGVAKPQQNMNVNDGSVPLESGTKQ